MLRREKYLEERDTVFLMQNADFDDILELNPNHASISISEYPKVYDLIIEYQIRYQCSILWKNTDLQELW